MIFSQKFFYVPFRCIFSDFFNLIAPAILFKKKTGNLPSEISHKIHIDKIFKQLLEIFL